MAEVRVRFARAGDREAVLAFCQHTWEHQSDYIHLVWDKWFAEPQGRIFVAVVNDVPVGIARVFLMSNSEAWWEGLRVDPAYRRRGIASILLSKIEHFVLESNIKVSRTCTQSKNLIFMGMMARRGRRKVGRYVEYQAISIDRKNCDRGNQLVQLKPQDFNYIWDSVTGFELLSEKPSLYVSRGAKWQELNPHQFKNCLDRGLVWGYEENDELKCLAIESHLESSKPTLWIGYVKGKPESLPILLLELRQLAFEKGYDAVGGLFPVSDDFLKSLEQAGYQEGYFGEAWVYEWQNF